jgi:thiamine-phosphate pyrophosphorylase
VEGQLLRIIDANLNRAAEGLRVLEEVARMLLNDAGVSQQLKDVRHDLLMVDAEFQRGLMDARDAQQDVGADMDATGDDKQRDVPSLVVANARRVQESLRVLEEVAKMPGVKLESDRYRRARFALYTTEKALLSGLKRTQ